MTDQIIWREIGRNGERRNRAWRIFQARQIKLGAKAHPATGGNPSLIHNWGNAEARRLQEQGWRRWRAISAAYDARYDVLVRLYGRSAA